MEGEPISKKHTTYELIYIKLHNIECVIVKYQLERFFKILIKWLQRFYFLCILLKIIFTCITFTTRKLFPVFKMKVKE